MAKEIQLLWGMSTRDAERAAVELGCTARTGKGDERVAWHPEHPELGMCAYNPTRRDADGRLVRYLRRVARGAGAAIEGEGGER